MGNCKDCKYWDSNDSNATKYGRECTNIAEVYMGSDLACIVISSFKASGYLRTKPDFGCVLFEKKDADNG